MISVETHSRLKDKQTSISGMNGCRMSLSSVLYLIFSSSLYRYITILRVFLEESLRA